MAELSNPIEGLVQGIKNLIAPTITASESPDLPPGFEDAEPIALPPGFEDTEPVREDSALGEPVTMGVESPSAAIDIGRQFKEEFEARKAARHAEISQKLGPAFNSEGQFDESFWTLWDVSRSASLPDKQRKFREVFPGGDLISVPTTFGSVLLARTDKESPYKEIGIAPTVGGALISEPMLLGTVGSFLGPVGTFSGTTLGVITQTAIEKARGFGAGEPGFMGAVTEGGVAAGVDLATRGASRVLLGRARTAAQQEAALKAILAAEQLDLEPIAVGQLMGPLGRGVFRQVAVTSTIPEKVITNQELSLLNAFRKMADDVPAANADDLLQNVVKAQQNELRTMLTFPHLSRADAGEALQKGIDTWRRATKKLGDRYYKRAFAAGEDVIFDLSPAQEVARDVQRGVLGSGLEGEAVSLAATPQGALKSAVDDILALDPRMARFAADGKEFSAFEQIKTLRTRLFDLKMSDDPAVRREASRLWQGLTDVMDHPISGNPDFVSSYRKASAFWRLREDTLEKSFVAQTLRSDTPEALARKYMNPNNATALATIRDLVPRPQWEQFRTGFIVDLMNTPTAQSAITRLRNFRAIDPDGLGVLLNPTEEQAIMKYLTQKAQFEASPARALLERKMTDAEKFVAMAEKGTVGEVADAVTKAGGINSDFAMAARAGIYKSIMDEASTINKQGVQVIDAQKLLSSIEKWQKSGKLDALFRPEDWTRLQMFQAYSAPVSETADIGGAMMAGALRQKIVDAPVATLFGRLEQLGGKVIKPLYQNAVTAYILSRPASYVRLAASSAKVPLAESAAALAIAEQELLKRESVKDGLGND